MYLFFSAVSSGTVYICREDIAANLQSCQRQLGYCPQTNPLFARLTVREHLRLYAKLKCLGDTANIDEEIDQITEHVQLKHQLDKVQLHFVAQTRVLLKLSARRKSQRRYEAKALRCDGVNWR